MSDVEDQAAAAAVVDELVDLGIVTDGPDWLAVTAAEQAAPGPDRPLPADLPPAPAGALAVGTYALYGDGRGGLVLVIQDGGSGEVRRFAAPPLVVRALRHRFPVLPVG